MTESEETSFICPYCNKELTLPKERARFYTCDYCSKRLDLIAQFAFIRGSEAFQEAYATYKALTFKKKKNPSFDATEQAMIRVFEEAYFSIQQAFSNDLAEPQRAQGVEMMVNISQLFLKWVMISGLEYNYWGLLMTEHSVQDEYEVLCQKLANPAGIMGLIMQVRWRIRIRQLNRSLVDLEEKIKEMEAKISFVYPLHARKSHWKPPEILPKHRLQDDR